MHATDVVIFNDHMDVSKNSGTPKSSMLIGFSIINHPFWGTTIFGNTHITHTKGCKCNDEIDIPLRDPGST